jgi:preprotein translocase subunit SecF
MEFFRKVTAFPFMATRRVWYTISGLLIVGSIGLLIVRGLNLGIDFTGGVTAEVAFPGTAKIVAVQARLVANGFGDLQVQNFGSSRDVLVRMPPNDKEPSAVIRARVDRAVKEVDARAEIRSFEVVGPQVGGELRRSALWALGFTMLLIFIYVALRFHTWKLSLGAIIAAMHDPILVLGFFALTQLSFDLSVVAAVLAVIGYSLNDTVVVFDRIRERFEANRRLAPQAVLDQSINQTLSRTIITSGTTMLTVVMLFLFGGPVLLGFSSALIVGIVVGTYSSIYVASASALDFGLTAEDIFPTVKKSAADDMP